MGLSYNTDLSAHCKLLRIRLFSSYSVYLAFTLVLILMGNATIEESCSIARKRSNSTAIKEGANSYGIEKHLADR